MRICVALCLVLLLPCSVFAEPYEVQDHEMMLALSEIQEEVDFISSAVMGCVDTGREHKDCMCTNKAMFMHFSESVTTLFAGFPELEKYDLVTFRDQKGVQVTQSMQGMKRQAVMDLDCEVQAQ